MTRLRTYSELSQLVTFKDRFKYLALSGRVGMSTFGSDRFVNQKFYTSQEWKRVRDIVIVRDMGRDLGIDGREIHDKILIHHMNPMRLEDIQHGNLEILDPEFLIATTHSTHNAIHFGDEKLLQRGFVERQPGDTKLW